MKIKLIALMAVLLIGGSAWADFSFGIAGAAKKRADKLNQTIADKKAAALAAIKIGSVCPLSGSYGPSGPDVVKGIQLALDQINAADGVLNKQLTLVSKDDQSNPDQGKAVTQELINEGVSLIIGPLSSGIGKKMMEAAVPSKTLIISPANTSPWFTTNDPEGYYFRTIPSDDMQGKVLAKLVDSLGHHSVGIISVNNAYGTGFEAVFTPAFVALGHGNTVVAMALYPESPIQASYASEVSQVFSHNPTACLTLSYFDDGAQIVKDGYISNTAVAYFGTDGMYGADLITKINNTSAANKVAGTAPASDTTSNRYQVFRNAYLAKYGVEPGSYSANAYDAAMLIGLGILKAGVANGETVKSVLVDISKGTGTVIGPGDFATGASQILAGQAINYEGAATSCDFDSVGDVGVVNPNDAYFEHWALEGNPPALVTKQYLRP
jgi:ABC-type branched-subunit amino acid transport system substrate-binding protein